MVGRTELPLERTRSESSPGPWGGCEGLTYGRQQCQVLQHHTVVQMSLSLIQEPPLLLGEVYGHILKYHTAL